MLEEEGGDEMPVDDEEEGGSEVPIDDDDEESGGKVPIDDEAGSSSSPQPAMEVPASEVNVDNGVEAAVLPPLPTQHGSKVKKRWRKRPGAATDDAMSEMYAEQSADEMLEALLSMRVRRVTQDDSDEDCAASLQSASSHADLPSQVTPTQSAICVIFFVQSVLTNEMFYILDSHGCGSNV